VGLGMPRAGGQGWQLERNISSRAETQDLASAELPRLGSWPLAICLCPQAMLLWSPGRSLAQPTSHDPRQTLYPHPRPPRLCKLGDPSQAGCGARATQPWGALLGNGRGEPLAAVSSP
jgi:hypothetical protein